MYNYAAEETLKIDANILPTDTFSFTVKFFLTNPWK